MKKLLTKKKIGAAILFTSVFAMSFGAAYYFVPAEVIVKELDDGNDIPPTPTTKSHLDQLLNSVVGSVNYGIGATIEDFQLSWNGAAYDDNGVTAHYENVIKALPGAGVKLSMDELNLHGLNLALDLPIDYNGKSRYIGAEIFQDMAYINLKNLDEGKEDKWDFKYKVDLASYDEQDEEGHNIVDPLTGGILRYEYGKLDWLIDDILNIILGEDSWISFSFPNIGDAIMEMINGSSVEEPGEETGEEDSDETSSILDSLQNMVEDETTHYFTWDLTLNGKTYQIGLQGDKDYNLCHIDFPAKVDRDYKHLNSVSPVTLNEEQGLKVKVSIDVQTANGEDDSFVFTAPEDAADYKDLVDSAKLFEDVSHLIAHPRFGLDANFTLTHTENATEEVAPTETTLKVPASEASSESMDISLKGNVDASGKDNKLAINSFDAALELSTPKPGSDTERYSQSIVLAYLDGENSSKDAYLNVNNVLRAKTNKATLDEFLAKFQKEIDEDPESAKESEGVEVAATSIADTIEKVRSIASKLGLNDLANIVDSRGVQGIAQGHYESLIDILDEITVDDNFIRIVLSLEPVGMEGSIAVTLDGSESASLLEIAISGFRFGNLGLEGYLRVADYQETSIARIEDVELYDELAHLPGVGEQISEIVDSKSAKLGLSLNLENSGKTDVLGEVAGLVGSGEIAFDLNSTEAAAKLTLTEHAASYYQDHNIAFELAKTGEGEDAVSRAYFHYDSYNKSAREEEKRTNPKDASGINGQINLTAAIDGVKDIVMPFFEEENALDDRFSRILSVTSLATSSSLISDISNKNYFSLLKYHVLKSASLAGDSNVFVVDGSLFGMENDITLTINYIANSDEKVGGIKDLVIDVPMNEKSLSVGLSLDATKAEEEDLKAIDESLNKEEFASYDSLVNLVDHLVGTATLGAPTHHGVSTYALSASLDLQLGNYSFNALQVNGNVYVNGAQIKAFVGIDNIPVIKGINGPENARYFRDHELMGSRDVGFYFYADGYDPEGKILMTRNSSYGRLGQVKDSVMISMANFKNNLSGWLLEYLIGVNEKFFEKSGEEEAATSSSSGLSKALHVDEAFKGLSYNVDAAGKSTWDIGLNLGKLIGMNFLGDVDLRLIGKRALVEDKYQNVLTGLEASVNLALMGELKVASASISASIDNVTPIMEEESIVGYRYEDGFSGSIASSNFAEFFSSEDRTLGSSDYGWIYIVDDEVIYNRNYDADKGGENGSPLLPGNYYVI